MLRRVVASTVVVGVLGVLLWAVGVAVPRERTTIASSHAPPVRGTPAHERHLRNPFRGKTPFGAVVPEPDSAVVSGREFEEAFRGATRRARQADRGQAVCGATPPDGCRGLEDMSKPEIESLLRRVEGLTERADRALTQCALAPDEQPELCNDAGPRLHDAILTTLDLLADARDPDGTDRFARSDDARLPTP